MDTTPADQPASPPESRHECQDRIGLIVLDHGSRAAESNEVAERIAQWMRQWMVAPVVEVAHLESAEPTLAQAYGRCAQAGARLIVIHPFFLGPGMHWKRDIPALAAEAAARFPQTRYLITAPLGFDPLLAQLVRQRVQACLLQAAQGGPPCSWCHDRPEFACRIQSPKDQSPLP